MPYYILNCQLFPLYHSPFTLTISEPPLVYPDKIIAILSKNPPKVCVSAHILTIPMNEVYYALPLSCCCWVSIVGKFKSLIGCK
jgi:hypothetical protein